MKGKLVFVTRGLHDGGGIERVTCYIASLLEKEGWTVEILCLQKKGNPYFPLSDRVKVVYQSDLEGICRIHRMRRYYQNFSPDLVICVGSNRSLTHYLSAKGFRIATWEHFNTTVQSHPFHSLSRLLATRLGWIITLTPSDAHSYRKRYRTEKVLSIPNPITIDGLSFSDQSCKRILSAGRLAGQKGFDRLLDAWRLIEKRHPDWQLRIVGSGKKYKALVAQIERLGLEKRVELLSHSKDMPEQYRAASIYAMTSRYEGFPLVLLEAMASALPIVSFDCPRGPADIVVHGETGLLVANNDIEGFASALERLIEDDKLRITMAHKAGLLSSKYTSQQIIKQWTIALNEMLHS